MTAQVFFVAGAAQNVLTIPLAALQDATATPDTYKALVLSDKGNVESRDVRTGLRDRMFVQVLAGLNEGERLLIGPPGGATQ